MDQMKFKLSVLWTATMLSYLFADVLRLYSAVYIPGDEFSGIQPTPGFWFGFAVLQMIPVVMIVLSATLKYQVNRWANIVFAVIFFLINAAALGISPLPSLFDLFISGVSLVFNLVTVWYAWKWKNQVAGVDPVFGTT